MTFEPSSLVTTIWSPSLKPLSSWAFSIVANAACAAAFCAASTSDLSALVSIAAVLAFTSALMSLTTCAVLTNASLLSLTVSVKSPNASSCAATTSFKPNPPKPSASTSACVAFLVDLTPSSSVTTISSPSLKPLSSCAFSIAASAACSAAFLARSVSAVKSARLWSCFAATSFRPSPPKSSALTSACVAVRMTFEPSSLVTTIWSPSLKPLNSWEFSIVANATCAVAFCVASNSLAKSSTPLLALSAFSVTASILEAASTALSAASLASFTLPSTLAESAVTLSSAALATALASAVSCARLSTRVFTAVTSPATFSMDSESSDEALEISLSTSLNLPEISSPIAVISSAIFLLLLAMVFFSSSTSWSTALSCSSKASSMSLAKLSTRVLTAVIPPAKPTPFMLSAAISALVASRTVLLPSSLVATKLLPAAKPLTACSSSIVFNNKAELSLSKVNFPVSSSNLVFSPKTVWNAIAFCAFSGIEPRSLSAAPAALLTTAAATAILNAFTLNFFMFFTFCGGCKDVIQASLFPVNWKGTPHGLNGDSHLKKVAPAIVKKWNLNASISHNFFAYCENMLHKYIIRIRRANTQQII